MVDRSRIPITARGFVTLVCVAGVAVLGVSIPAVVRTPSADWLILAALTLLTGSFTVKVPSLSARLSVSETFVFAAVLLYGHSVATVIVAMDTLVMSLRLAPGHRSSYRLLFNVASGSLAIWIAGRIFFWLAGTSSVPVNSRLENLVVPGAALAVSYFLLNTWLISIALSFQRRVSAYSIWRTSFVWLVLNYVGAASVATLLVSYTRDLNLTALGIIVPLLSITYLTYRTSMGRLEDANRHVNQLNELYLSAIETLAMAVDAKDQITHGHIRRVQVYATELAKRLGVTDEQQLKAIEAAALLHDMGKLAIPEHILNKPGKLSPGEFETMKRHSDIGADLLSSIPFPYPVVPIVRHHHENWDGTGYPNGIAGTDIPFGARILSVVDCFDALTSDRPYRPRLSDEAAFTILRERRGTMYDPLILDAFENAYGEIAPAALEAGQAARTLVPIHTDRTSVGVPSLDEIRRSAAEMRDVVDARRAVCECSSFADALEVVARVARQHTAATVIAVYMYDASTDMFRCTTASGDSDGLLRNLTIASGERTTGWAAAHNQAVSNSSATLDLGSRGRNFAPPLKSALAVPFPSACTSKAVMTLYSTLETPYGDHDLFIAEQLTILLGEFLDAPNEQAGPVLRFREGAMLAPGRRSYRTD
jgi:putative nucleotidyltransferase with HDIG domain